MSMLPRSLDIGELLSKAFPEDITVAEAWATTRESRAWKSIMQYTNNRATLSIRYRETNKNVPSDMTLKEVRRLVNLGTVVIVIDDGSGGELV